MNLRTTVQGLACLISLSGCAADISQASASGHSVNPAGNWLASLWTRAGDERKGELQMYELHGDGTGLLEHDQYTYESSDHNSWEIHITWDSDGKTFTFEGNTLPLGHVPNCRS